ncbi:AAA family ATPase [Roseofilum sp. BLCC_M154]|uniref:AAA family ATPase n=1 Tax=Roseofilum acuticapitatum BLCC-M154 TaxID=3022444 RepID=A0ABT7AZG6_9CYAN|nr:AAA family ATPase [Roseofilum acuticapitatum]MDJ1172299.1 AAA family ATPase [Roseofilum acuticapitatum BLCC-M154]
MNDLFKGFEDLLELAKRLEEKAEKGELKTDIQFRSLSNIPQRGNMPKRNPSQPSPDVIITPPPLGTEGNQETSPSSGNLSLNQIGGLEEVKQELRELVELPLKRPELLAQLGLEPTRGVLLVGPPGTGKTLIARCLAAELGVNYIAITGPEIMGKYYGESEARLRELFDKAARNAPCLIFIDEIDSLAPDRSQVEGEVEKRVVGQLLGLMDGFAVSDSVVVLAATNLPNRLDPALRRPGRFDREIVFRVPRSEERVQILQILSQGMPLESSVDLEAIAARSVGFVGADLKALCQKAAHQALRRQVPTPDTQPTAPLTINSDDFDQALSAIKPAVLRSVEVESPQVAWQDIGGLDEIKQLLQESVEGQLLYPELYQKTQAKAPKGILLMGEPGTGKTLLAKAIASQAQANFIAISGPELLSRWVGASEQAVRELFAKARQASPCVIFIDEIDTLAPARGQYSGDSGVGDRVVGQLLTEIDGLSATKNLILIAATNRPEAIDPALLRSGRLDLQLKIDLPDTPSRLAILQVHNQDRPLSDVDLSHYAQLTQEWSGADLALLSNQAALQAIRRFRTLNQPVSELYITRDDFQQAYTELKTLRGL